MNPKELRIGNMVCPIQRNTEVHMPATLVHLKVMAIGLFDAQVVGSSEKAYAAAEWPTIPINDLAGIPLTEEWLLKAGFRDKGLNVYRHDNAMLEMWNVNDLYFRGYYKGSSGIVADTKYVHQLQNLYFALTGEELELKH